MPKSWTRTGSPQTRPLAKSVADFRGFAVVTPDRRVHLKRNQQASYMELLKELERHVYPSPRMRQQMNGDLHRWRDDFKPQTDYGQDFLQQTLLYLWGTPGEDAGRDWIEPTSKEKALGRRGKQAIIRLLFEIDRKGRGRELKNVDAYRDDVRRDRPAVLDEARYVLRTYRPPEGDAEDYRSRLMTLWRRHLPHHPADKTAKHVDRLLAQPRLRPVDVANVIVGTKLGLSPSRVQRLASR